MCVCGAREKQSHSSFPKLYIRCRLRPPYDAFPGVCILGGILPAPVISWNAHGIFLQDNISVLSCCVTQPEVPSKVHVEDFREDLRRVFFLTRLSWATGCEARCVCGLD